MVKRVRRIFRDLTQKEQRQEQLFEDVKHGQHCLQLLEDPILTDFWAKQEEQLVERMLSLDPDDDKGRYRLAVAVQAVRQCQEYLRRSAEIGAVARAELDALEDGPRRGLL